MASISYEDYANAPLNRSLVSVTSILSMLGSIVMIGSYVAWKDIRSVSRNVLVWLSVCDFFIALGNICGVFFDKTSNDTKCITQSFVISTASINSFFWSVTLAYCLYLTIIKNKHALFQSFLPYLHIFNWSFGLIINIVAVSKNKLGNTADEVTAGWCWIRHQHNSSEPKVYSNTHLQEIIWMLIDYKAIEILAYIAILIIYMLIKIQLSKEMKLQMRGPVLSNLSIMKLVKSADRKLIFIPMVLIFARIPGTIRFYIFVAGKVPSETFSKILLNLQGIGDSAQGLINCIFFCFLQAKVQQHLKDFFLKIVRFCCCCCFSAKDRPHDTETSLHTNARDPLLDRSRPVASKITMNVDVFTDGSANITPSNWLPFADYAGGTFNQTLVAVTCILSALGSFTIISSYVCWKDVRRTSRKILLFLSISDLLIALTNILGLFTNAEENFKHPYNTICVMQSFVTNSVSIMSFMWTMTLAVYLHMAIIQNKQALGKKLLPWCHLVNWSLGLIINAVAVSNKRLGYSADALTGGWCWIYHNPVKNDLTRHEIVWHLLDAKAIEMVVYTSIFVIYFKIKFRLHRELKIRSQAPMQADVLKSAKSADRKLIFVPILLFLGRFWGLLRFFLCLDGGCSKKHITNTDKAFLTLQGIGDSIQGFLNCILFCFLNPKVYNHLKEAFMYYICCQRNRDHPQQKEKCLGKPDERSVNGEEARFSSPTPTSAASTIEDDRPLLDKSFVVRKYGSQWE